MAAYRSTDPVWILSLLDIQSCRVLKRSAEVLEDLKRERIPA